MSVPLLSEFPSTPEQLSATWLTEVLRSNQVMTDVAAFEFNRIGTGQIGQNVRIRITYGPDAPEDAPATLVAKFVSPDATSRATGMAMGNYQRERDFYRDMAPVLRTAGMRVPRCWAAEFDAAREATVVVLQDMAPAEQGDQLLGCTVADAEVAIGQAAILHATFWESPLLHSTPWLRPPVDAERADQLKGLVTMMWPAFVDRYRDRLSAEAEALGNRLVEVVDRWALSRTGPFTITHGDFRIDNLLFGDDPNRWAVAVDWQTPDVGVGGLDIGYFIGAGLLENDRRAHEERLVHLWHNQLLQLGVTGYSWDKAWNDYRQGQFAGIIMAIVASMITERTPRGDEMFWAMGGRHFQAALDLDAASLLPR